MEKGFKAGDRVHVTRFNGEDVNFYATLKEAESINALFSLSDCSNTKYEEEEVFRIVTKDGCDYYTLATDEEDTDKPDRQSITKAYNKAMLKNYEAIEIMQDTPDDKIELDNHYIIEVKKDLYVALVTSNGYLKFTKDINKADVYEYENAALKHAEFVDGRVLNLKRYVEVE